MCNPDTCRKVGKKNKKLQICKVLCHTHTTGMNNRCGVYAPRGPAAPYPRIPRGRAATAFIIEVLNLNPPVL